MTMFENARAVSLRISLTRCCELRCLYCRGEGSDADAGVGNVLRFDEILALVGALAERFGLSKVRLTGGEPLLREGVAELVAELVRLGVPDVTVTTNGQQLKSEATRLHRAGLRRINVSLDSLDPSTYRMLTRGGELEPTIRGIEAAVHAPFSPVKLNMVVLRGINDGEVARVARFGLERFCHVRFLELMPIGVAAARHDEWFVPSAEVRERLTGPFELEPLPIEPGSSSRNFLAKDRSSLTGTFGFVSPCTEPFCDGCRRLRLTASGRLLGCLAKGDAIDIRPLLQGSRERLFDAVERALKLKRRARGFALRENMVSIGG